ncbi:hypothetical protein F8M41_019212 [Gigaspora margarita]|uniref:Uncharacterized protein n=1 Tax=Gigaspora margarita TaxID=4874 RepID=A0A8H4AKB5_GIGMA|nr:hypothetical protein F8M41_019212 [Gigaspora margarita]
MGDDPDPNSFYDDVDPVKDMRRQLEDLKINLTKKMNKAIKKIPSKPKSSCHKTKSKSRTKKKKLSKHVNAHIISDESSLDSSDSENIDSFTRTQPKEVSINGYNMINAKFIALKDPVLNHFTSNFSDKEPPEGSQSEAEISWPNPIEINFIRKIISNDVATIYCKISLPLGKIVQVPSTMIDSGANCSVISKGLIKLLEAEVDKNKKPSVKWCNNSLESSGISYNISVMVGQEENSCTIFEDFPVMDDDKPWILLGTPWLDRAG